MRGLLAALACALVPSVAAADSLDVVGGSGTARELSHVIDVSVEPGQATLRVERTFSYAGPGTADVHVTVALPRGGVITGLGAPNGGEAEAHWREGGARLVLRRLAKGKRRRVSYRVEVPLVVRDGRSTVWLPRATAEGGMVTPIVRQRGEVLLPQHDSAWDPIGVNVPTSPEGQARWGAASVGHGWLWRTEVDAPARFGKPVKDANVVFVLDASTSQGVRGMQQQLVLLHEWARAMPRARFMVVAYNRGADSIFPTWKRAEDMQDVGVGHSKLVLRNGSELDAAMPLVTQWLRDQSGPGFVVIATDGELRATVQAQALADALSSLDVDNVVHLILSSGRRESGAPETRADAHRLAPVALANRGVPLEVALPKDWPEPPERVVVQSLMRVAWIDRFGAAVDGRPYLGAEAGARLHERGGAVAAGRSAGEPGKVVPMGMAWGSPWTMPAVRTAAVDRRALLFATDAVNDRLRPDEVEAIGRRLNLVSWRTSLRATGSAQTVVAPPATVGPPEPSTASQSGEPDPPAEVGEAALRGWFSEAIAPCIAAHEGPAETISASVELSWNEILDVSAPSRDPATGRCIEDAIWAVQLTDDQVAPHAFGMLAIQVAGADRERLAREAGPPTTEAGRIGGCRFGGSPGRVAWLFAGVLVALCRRHGLGTQASSVR